MHVIGGLLLLTLARVSLSFSRSFWNDNICDASVAPNKYGATLAKCSAPSSKPPSTQFSSPATIRDVKVTWSPHQDDFIKLHITLDAIAPVFAQEYKIVVSTGSSVYPIYCGKVSTLKHNQRQRQMITVTLDCLQLYLKPGETALVATGVKGAPASADVSKRIVLPGCEDSVMYRSMYCVEERKVHISFTLTQQGDSVQVVISPQTRYLPGSQFILMILKRDEIPSSMPWKQIDSIITLTHPQTLATFSKLENGATYRVLVWRASDPALRYQKIISLKQ